ncbi:MAG: DUF4200 domain-containing protein [Crocinitomicaceae bacterium]|nr:DUF4200 domain-containing protein [Crocinitomicaceae bacterium]
MCVIKTIGNIKGLILFSFILAFGSISIAQNPTVITDSLVVQQRLYAKEKLIVDQEAKFKQDVIIKGDIKAKSDVRIDSLLKVDGNTRLLGNVKMEGLGNATTLTAETEIVLIMPNGNLIKGSVAGIINAFANPQGLTTDYCTANGGVAQWWAVAQKLFTACPDVNVGIRTDDPQFALHVAGVNYAFRFLAGNPGATSEALFNGFSPNDTQTLVNIGVKIGGDAEQARFSISNDGNIKMTNIGTSPSFVINNGKGHAIVVYSYAGNKILQLEDDGKLRSRGVIVNVDTWADYVFNAGYELMSLPETQVYIQSNGHLPGVPSQEELTEEGLDLGEMQRIQMEKIEELYLQLIKMNTEIERLKNEISTLKTEKSKTINN